MGIPGLGRPSLSDAELLCSFKSAADEARIGGGPAGAVDQLVEEAQAAASAILAALRSSHGPSTGEVADAAGTGGAARPARGGMVLRQRLQSLASSELESSSQVRPF